jgi:hypothetical protein
LRPFANRNSVTGEPMISPRIGGTDLPPTSVLPSVKNSGLIRRHAAANTCPGDQVVWIKSRSHIHHFSGQTWFGHTKDGVDQPIRGIGPPLSSSDINISAWDEITYREDIS